MLPLRKMLPIIRAMLKDYDLNIDRLDRGYIFIEQKEKELEQLESPVELKDCVQVAIANITGMPYRPSRHANSPVENSIFHQEKAISKEDIRQMINKEKSRIYTIKKEVNVITDLIRLVELKLAEKESFKKYS